jgi:hypothetical protein
MTMVGLFERIKEFLFGSKKSKSSQDSKRSNPSVSLLKNLFALKKQAPKPFQSGPETFANEIDIMYRRFIASKTFLTGTSENTEIISFRDKNLMGAFHQDLKELHYHLEFARDKFKIKQKYSNEVNDTYERILQALMYLLNGKYYTSGYESFNKEFPFVNYKEKSDLRVIKFVCTRYILLLNANIYLEMHPIYRSYIIYINIMRSFDLLKRKVENEDRILQNRSFL